MKITFAGTVIATSFRDGGTDALQGFEPDSTGNVQWQEPMRAPYAKPLPRDNVKTTITGTITRNPGDTLGDALLARALEYGALPRVGDLVFQSGEKTWTYADAVRGPGKPLKDAKGVSYAYQITFYAGECKEGDAGGGEGGDGGDEGGGGVLGTGGGGMLGTGDGGVLGTGS